MSSTISNFLLTQVINYGAPLFALTLFLGALGVPLPSSIMVIAVGAFSQEGYFSWLQMSIVGLLAAFIGDALSFGMGYYGKGWVQRKFGNSAIWISARDSFQRQAWVAIFLTRFLITALAIPTNWIAGGSGYKFSRFILYDIFGEFTWIIVYGGLGYLFGSQWELVNDFISNFGGVLFGAVIVGVGIWYARNSQNSNRNIA